MALEFDSREVGGKAVVIVLRDRFKRMIVAFGTLDANSQEQLRRRFDARCLHWLRHRLLWGQTDGRWLATILRI